VTVSLPRIRISVQQLDLVAWIRIEAQSWIRISIETNMDPKYNFFLSVFSVWNKIYFISSTFEKSIVLVLVPQVCGFRWKNRTVQIFYNGLPASAVPKYSIN
jgi:hypothetical protein